MNFISNLGIVEAIKLFFVETVYDVSLGEDRSIARYGLMPVS